MQFEREFFYDEVRDGFYIPGIMKRAWGAELTILSEVDRICKKYDISYYADGGTLLGAVRDGQFIPWDDDLDIMMLREDYNRFVQVVQQELPEEMSFYSFEVCKEYETFASSVGKAIIGFDAALLRKYQEIPYSLGIDIFVLDALSNDPEDEEYRNTIWELFLEILKFLDKDKKRESFNQALKEIENLFDLHFDKGKKLKPQIYRLLYHLFQEFNEAGGDYLANMPYYAFKGTCKFPRSAFKKTRWIPFHGMQLPIPADYDAILRSEYTDYHKKVRSIGEHDYPCLRAKEKELHDISQGKWDLHYHFSDKDLVHYEIQNFRDLAMSMAEAFTVLQKQLFEYYHEGDIHSCLLGLASMQEKAILFGNAIEQKKGKGTESVSILEQYCDALYHAHEALMAIVELNVNEIDEQRRRNEMHFPMDFSSALQKEMQRTLKKPSYYLKKLNTALKKEFKKQVVFLPHSAKHFESLRPLVDALLEAGDTECKIIPIPYYDRYGDGSLKEMHYEGEDFPKEYEITDYRNYNFATELPDCIVINSPYDQFNPVWMVDPHYFSGELKQYTKKLVYIPWFVTDEINPKEKEDGKAFRIMDYYVNLPGLFHSDLSIVQSEGMKKAYLSKITEFAGKDIRKKMSKKISGAGSCLLGEKEGQGVKEVVSCFRRFLFASNKNLVSKA